VKCLFEDLVAILRPVNKLAASHPTNVADQLAARPDESSRVRMHPDLAVHLHKLLSVALTASAAQLATPPPSRAATPETFDALSGRLVQQLGLLAANQPGSAGGPSGWACREGERAAQAVKMNVTLAEEVIVGGMDMTSLLQVGYTASSILKHPLSSPLHHLVHPRAIFTFLHGFGATAPRTPTDVAAQHTH
jgi:hypothetical protein